MEQILELRAAHAASALDGVQLQSNGRHESSNACHCNASLVSAGITYFRVSVALLVM